MDHVNIASVGELRAVLAGLGGELLFRGQVEHFEHEGAPSIVTSFDRKGCIPSAMQRWIRYADDILRTYFGASATTMEMSNALLQHYGWRSFYVDCTSNPGVGAWFASHRYSDSTSIEICEDCHELPLLACKRQSRYDFEAGTGHLYVIDTAIAASLVGTHDLAKLSIDGFRPRPVAQQAWLLGSFRKSRVPVECLRAHIVADRAIFREFAAEAGIAETEVLFPTAEEDPILNALLATPWKHIELGLDDDGLPAFQRSLDIPEYQDSFRKIASPSTAFFAGARVADGVEVAGTSDGTTVVQVPEITVFGTADPQPLRFPEIEKLLKQYGCVTFEIPQLLRHTCNVGTPIYQKGVVIWERAPDVIEVCELGVSHPGLRLVGASLVPGWHYARGPGSTWVRQPNPNDCDCNDLATHQRHVSALHIIEAYLQEPMADW